MQSLINKETTVFYLKKYGELSVKCFKYPTRQNRQFTVLDNPMD